MCWSGHSGTYRLTKIVLHMKGLRSSTFWDFWPSSRTCAPKLSYKVDLDRSSGLPNSSWTAIFNPSATILGGPGRPKT